MYGFLLIILYCNILTSARSKLKIFFNSIFIIRIYINNKTMGDDFQENISCKNLVPKAENKSIYLKHHESCMNGAVV